MVRVHFCAYYSIMNEAKYEGFAYDKIPMGVIMFTETNIHAVAADSTFQKDVSFIAAAAYKAFR